MNRKIVQIATGATLIAAGDVRPEQIGAALAHAPFLVAADGGADTATGLARIPDAVIGDMDSIGAAAGVIPTERLIRVDDQDSTDFEKCLALLDLPFVIALGLTGSRADHGLAAMNALARHRRYPVLALSGEDVIAACPASLELELPVGTRLSLFPMTTITGRSDGLAWPIDGLDFAPDGQIGTSNRTDRPHVRLDFDGHGMLIILPAAHLAALMRALGISSSVR